MKQDNQTKGMGSKIARILVVGAPYLAILTVSLGFWKFCFEREKEATARYLNIIRELGNDSNSVRAGAVITMGTYLKIRDEINEKYREQGIYVLATHLAVEPTPLVRSTTQEVLVNIGEMDNDNIVVRKLICSNRHLWEQSGLTAKSLIPGAAVSRNLQSIANTLIQIFQLKKCIYSQAPEPLDLSNIYLMSDNYSLEDVNIFNVQLDGACLVRMNFQKCTIEECKLRGAHLNDAILTEAKLTSVDLQEANLTGAEFEGATFNDVSLLSADLSKANLKRANLTGASLKMAMLLDAKLSGAILQGANLEDANLEGADLRALILFDVDSKKFQSDLDESTISKDLRQEFEDNLISLSKNTTVSVEEKDLRWLINDKDNNQTYTVRKEERLNICTEPNMVESELLSIDTMFQSDFDKGTISEDLRQEFKINWFNLSENTAISVEEKGRTWLITDKDNEQTYTVKKEEWLNICRETKFDFTDIKKARNWQNAIFDNDVRQKLLSQQK